MESINGKIDGDPGAPGFLPAAEFNQIATEVENVILDAGLTLDSGDLSQLSKAITNLVANADFYTDSGSANAYVLTPIGTNTGPTLLRDGMKVEYETANPNTGASTVNVSGTGVTSILLRGGAALESGDVTGRVKLRYDAANTRFELQNPALASSAAASGYTQLSSGIVLQWGVSVSVGPDSDSTITLPIAFSSAGYSLVTSPRVSSPIGAFNKASSAGNIISATQVTVSNSGDGATYQIYYFCVGT